MDRRNELVSSEALLQQLGWMRGLARALVGSSHADEADDVVQEAATAALARAKGPVAPESWRGWLAGTVRRLAWRRRRDDERRIRRERGAARPEAIESASSAADRLSRHRRVVEALEALEPLLRDALVLRFYDGLPPRAIAERLRVPVETVKTRIKRGLERLRARLVGEVGGDARLRAFLLPLAGGAPGAAIAVAVGAMVMGGKAKAVAAALLLAAGMGAWQLVASGGEVVSLAREVGVDAASRAASTAPSARPDLALPVVAAERRDAGAPRFEPPALQPTALLHGRVVDARGGLAAGARVQVEREDGELDAIGLDPDRSRVVTPVADVVADARGTFSVAVAPNRPHALYAELGDEIALVQPCFGDEELVIALAPAARLQVRVVAERRGAPVERATVSCRSLAQPRVGEMRGLTDEEGVATFARMLAGRVRLTADTDTRRTTKRVELDLVAGETAECEVLVAEKSALLGRVVDATSGAPVAGADVREDFFASRSARTDLEGRFHLPGFGSQQITVRARGYGLRKWYGIDPERNEGERTFPLERARVARGRVVDGEGRPLDRVHAVAFASEFGSTGLDRGEQVDFAAADSDDDGRFVLVDLDPTMEHTLQLGRPGYARQSLLFPRHERDALVVDLGTIEMRAPALVAGKVVDPSGAPLRGRSILLSGIDGEWATWQPERALYPPSAMRSYSVDRWSALDSRGRFQFDDLAPGIYRLEVGESDLGVVLDGKRARERRSGATGASTFVTLATGVRRDDVVLQLLPLTSIAGTLVDEAGDPIERATLSLRGSRDSRRGWFLAMQVRDGAFEVDGLVPGRLALIVSSFGSFSDPKYPALVRVELDDVEAGTRDLRIVVPRGRWLQGIVRDPSGAPLSRVAVAARSRGELFGPVASDEQGKFAFVVPRDDSVDIEVRGPANHLAIENFAALFDSPEAPTLLQRAVAPAAGALELVVPAPR